MAQDGGIQVSGSKKKRETMIGKQCGWGKGGIWSCSNQPGGMAGEWKQEK